MVVKEEMSKIVIQIEIQREHKREYTSEKYSENQTRDECKRSIFYSTYLVDTGVDETEEVLDESIGTSVFDPVVVGVNSTTELTRSLSVRNILGSRVGRTSRECSRTSFDRRSCRLNSLWHKGLDRSHKGESEKGRELHCLSVLWFCVESIILSNQL